MYAILTLQFGLSPDYVLDRMQWYEINALLKYGYYSVKDGWEQARLISYLIAQTNSTKKLSMNDIIKFYWEKEEIEESPEITKIDAERLKQLADNYINNINQVKDNGTN